MKHLNSVLNYFSKNQPIGVIGASMGGALALELARQNPKKTTKSQDRKGKPPSNSGCTGLVVSFVVKHVV